MTPYLIGILAGIASAILVKGTAYAGILSVMLMMITPLPIAIASLGWGTRAALSSIVVAIIGLVAVLGVAGAAVYTVLAALPVALAGYELGLARPAAEVQGSANDNGLVWFPIGRVLAHISLVIGVGLIILGFLSGHSIESATAEVTKLLTEVVGTTDPAPDSAEVEALAAFMVQGMPFFVPSVWCLLVVLNLWLGGRIVRASGQLSRPWPDLASVEIDLPYALLFAASVALAMTSGTVGFAARPIAGALFTAFFLVGLGVLHWILRGRPARAFVLPLTYVSILVISLPALLLAAIGALEPLVRLRSRLRPPGSPSNG